MKWIMGLLLPTLFSIIAIIMLIAKPNPNSIFGYRTIRSTSDEKYGTLPTKSGPLRRCLLAHFFAFPPYAL